MHLEVDFPGYILRPGGTVKVPITFYPREVTSYHELIPFEINGLCQRTVEVQGKGAEMKVRGNPNPKPPAGQHGLPHLSSPACHDLVFLLSFCFTPIPPVSGGRCGTSWEGGEAGSPLCGTDSEEDCHHSKQ